MSSPLCSLNYIEVSGLGVLLVYLSTMIQPNPDLTNIDPMKLDFDLDVRHLSRELIITIKVLDDKTFSALSVEALSIFADAKIEFAKMKKDMLDLKNRKP